VDNTKMIYSRIMCLDWQNRAWRGWTERVNEST